MYGLFEATAFNFIGYGLIFLAALLVVSLIVVRVFDIICGAVWGFLDDGENEYDGAFKKVFSFLYTKGCVVGVDGEYYVQTANGYYVDSHSQRWSSKNRIPDYRLFRNKDAAEELLSIQEYKLCWAFTIAPVLVLLLLGFLFIFIPTTTLWVVGLIATMFVARSARRGIKKIKKVSAALEAHKIDKDAHKR